ncbi:hypothetical protein BG006_010849 [Podila minutissima]|uniref:Uncharacterized protein n=1 Tax=Podila minutissima TaxID=64525 RepID=A0A9P5SPY8_9FUNG|nr:hypothetical protein BG006_010849 [Podila minutissima]
MGLSKMNMSMSMSTVLVLSATLALLSSTLVSAALTPAEIAAVQLKEGPDAKLCPPCLQKAMHNHFPHACARDLDPNEANYRPSGATDTEERCVCLAFQDLFWMKADCSAECPHVFNEAGMKYFLPASEIEGCGRWLNFETGEEKVVEGFPLKNKDHKPDVFEIVAPPPLAEGEEVDDGRVKISLNMGHREKTEEEKLAELEEKKAAAEVEGEQTKEETKASEPEAEAIKKDEL